VLRVLRLRIPIDWSGLEFREHVRHDAVATIRAEVEYLGALTLQAA
jgi:hypothetical protein